MKGRPMNLDLLVRVNELQSRLGHSDPEMAVNARKWIEHDDELLRRWIADLEGFLAFMSLPRRANECCKPRKAVPQFFVLDVHETDPESHRLDIFIGERQPDVPEGAELHVFFNMVKLRDYLLTDKWDMATIYKSPKRTKETVDALADWMSLKMDLRQTNINGV
jgi:hypothetical protein